MVPTVPIMVPIGKFVNGKSTTYSAPLYYLLLSRPQSPKKGRLGKEIISYPATT